MSVVAFTDRPSWEAAVGSFVEEDFNDSVLNPDVSVVSDNGYIDSAGYWWDRLIPGSATTTWYFDKPQKGYGGDWNLSDPGGPGTGIKLYLDGVLVGQEMSRYTNGFFGVTSDIPFDEVRLEAGTQSGWCETYNLDNMVMSLAGPYVVSHDPSGEQPEPVAELTLTFNQPMNHDSFVCEDDIVSFTGPEGNVAVSGHEWLDEETLQLTFDLQYVVGSYGMVLGPEIVDLEGNPMAVAQTITFAVGAPSVLEHAPSGSVAGPIEVLQLTFEHPMDQTSFLPEDDVISFTGPEGPLAVSGSRWLDDQALEIQFDAQSSLGSYELVLGPEVLSLWNNPLDQDGDLIVAEAPDDWYTATFTIAGAKVVDHTPSGYVTAPVQKMQFSFDQPMEEISFSPEDDVVSFTGPNGPIAIDDHRWVDPQTLELSFDQQGTAGEYELVLGPQILNLAGIAMDQDEDFNVGEEPDDQYTATFTRMFVSNITEDTVWGPIDPPIIFDSTVTVASGATLTIEAGSTLKFSGGARLVVNGNLDIRGTLDSPVILTSYRDDEAGGDTNGDGDATSPAANDWGGIEFNSSATGTLDNVEIAYASTAIDANAQYANVTLRNAVLRNGGRGIYVYSPYAQIEAENVLIADNQRTGVYMRASSGGVYRNCTIVGNGFSGSGLERAGIHIGAATMLFDSCIVAFNANGINHSSADDSQTTVRNSAFYNPDGQNIIWTAGGPRPPLDQNGNVTADPLFVDRSADNYELGPGSPSIDSGRGIQAPSEDLLGRARRDDQGMPNVGTGYPAFVDMGAYERQEDCPTADLMVTYVSYPDPEIVTAGDTFNLEWTVSNIGAVETIGTWQDFVYLSHDPYLGGDELLATVDHTEPLAAGASYTESVTATVPATSGPQYVLVHTKLEATDQREAVETNNLGVSSRVLAVDVPLLELGTPLGATATYDQWDYYRFEGEPGRTVLFTLDGEAGSAELYLCRTLPPTLSSYDAIGSLPNQPNQELRLLDPVADTYYVGVFPKSLGGGSGSYTLSADLTTLDIREVTPNEVGNAGTATIKILGDAFDPAAEVQLVAPDSTIIEGDEYYQDSATLFATFDLAAAGAAPGLYDVVVTNPGPESVTAYDAVTVADGGVPGFSASLSMPGVTRPGRVIDCRIDYTNTGSVDILAPILTLESGVEDTAWSLPWRDGWIEGPDFHVMGLSSDGMPTILHPGQTESVVVELRVPFRPERVTVTLSSVGAVPTDGSDTPIDWDEFETAVRPDDMDSETWDDLLPILQTQIGETWGGYASTLRENVDRWYAVGRTVYCVRELFEMEMDQALGSGTSIMAGVLWEADTGDALADTMVVARQEVDEETAIIRFGITDQNGRFIVDRLPAGTYELYVEGYLFDPTPSYSVAADTDLTGLALYANPLPEQPVVEPMHVSESDPSLVVDASGIPHMVWKHGGEIWHAYHDGTQWVADAIPGASGSAPCIAAGGQLIDGTSPGVIVAWRTENPGDPDADTLGDSDLHYTVGRLQDGGAGMQWAESKLLSSDTVDDRNLALAIAPDGQVVTVWQKQDPNIADDTDLYFQLLNVESSDLTWLDQLVAEIDSLVTSEIAACGFAGAECEAGMSPAVSFSISHSIDLGNFSVPSFIPFVGGEYGASLSFDATGTRDCTASIQGSVSAGAKVGKVTASGGGSVSASWKTECGCDGDQKVSKYVFDKGQLQFTVAIDAQLPAWSTSFGVVTIEVGAIVQGQAQGTLAWQGANFPGWPNAGSANLTVGVGPYGSIIINPPGTWFDAEGKVSGVGSVSVGYDTNTGWTGGFSLTLSAEAGWGPFKVKWEKTWPSGSPMVAAAEDDGLVITLDPLLGSDNVYAGDAVLANVSESFRDDGAPSVAVAPSGETVLGWTRDSETPAVWLGSEVAVASLDGTEWSTPVTLPDSRGFNSDVKLIFDADGNPLAVWSMADSSTVNLDSTVEEALTATADSDLVYSVETGGVWSSPTTLAEISGSDAEPTLGAGADGEIVAGWMNEFEGTTVLYVSSWDGTAWSPPEAIGTGELVGTSTVGVVDGLTTVIWTQDVGTAEAPELSLATSSYDPAEGEWTSAVVISPTGGPGASISMPADEDSLTSSHLAWLEDAPPDGMSETVVTYFVATASEEGNPPSSEAIQRVHEAAQVWNQADALVTLLGVGSEADADVYVHFADTSACGTVENGILACCQYSVSATPSGTYPDGNPLRRFVSNQETLDRVQVLTFVNGWDWYTGADDTVPAGQHDLTTVAVHEFGHFLGLGHSLDPLSPMYPSFSDGSARRGLANAEIAALQYLYAGTALDTSPSVLEGLCTSDEGAAGAFSIGTPPDHCCPDCKQEEDPDPDGEEEDEDGTDPRRSYTPEDKFGPGGYDAPGTPEGSEVRFIPAGQMLDYRVDFWNKEDAPVPTQDAIIMDQLDPNVVDLSTLEFTRIGFLNWDVELPGGQVIDTRIDCRPEMDIAVEVRAGLGMEVPGFANNADITPNTLVWWFHAIDPETGEWPEDPMAGFLPPYNPETGYEIGWVEFTVDPVEGLGSGTQLANLAYVEFDFAGDIYDHPAPKVDPDVEPAEPAPWINTIDAGVPESHVLPLPATSSQAAFLVQWTGQDEENGSGLAGYDVYVSTDGSAYVRWLEDIAGTSAVFPGGFGHTYTFYSIATDNVGHREPAPAAPDAQITIPPNQKPVANDDFPVMDEDTVALIDVLGNDTDDGTIDPTRVRITYPAGHGSLVVNPDGTVTYTPEANYCGTDSFKYKVKDEHRAESNAAMVTITLNAINDPPVITTFSVTPTVIDEGGTVSVTGGFTDPDLSDVHTVVIDWADGTGTTLTLAVGDRTFSATHPYPDDNPTDTFSDDYAINVTVTDDRAASDSAGVTLTVKNVAPTLSDVLLTPEINEGEFATLSGTISDPGTQDTFTLEVDWADGSPLESFSFATGTTTFSVSHQYLDDDPSGTTSDDYTISFTLTDDDTGSAGEGPLVWTGPTMTFTKADYVDWTLPASQDRITDNVWITRQNNEGIFNIRTETYYDAEWRSWSEVPSPANTEWAFGSAADWESLTFSNWVVWHNWDPPDMVGEDAVLHLIEEDVYLDIKFTSWTSGGDGGGFSYERATPGLPGEKVWTGPTITFAKDDYADWVDPANQDHITQTTWITRRNTKGIFNFKTELAYDFWVSSSPADTEWAFGSLSDWQSLAFGPWAALTGGWNEGPTSILGKDLVLHLISDDIYVDIKFTSWTSGGDGGGFSYERSTESAAELIATVMVNNVDPTAAIEGAPESCPVGTPVDLSCLVTDPGLADTFTYAWSVTKDGAAYVSGTSVDLSFTPDEPATYVVTLDVTDDDGGMGGDSKTIEVTAEAFNLIDFDVQQGATQRSYVRYLDLVFEEAGGIEDLIGGDRVRLTRYGLDGSGGSTVSLAGVLSAVDNRLLVDFGEQGIGGNRNSIVGDGYYEIGLDLDNNGSFETTRHFYRLFGDVNGDRRVDLLDANAILAQFGQVGSNLEEDTNGDGVVNALDRIFALRSLGRLLDSGLYLDD